MGTSTKDGGFFQCELETTTYDWVDGVRFQNRHDGDTIARPVARPAAVNGEVDAILMDGTRFRLGVDRPSGV